MANSTNLRPDCAAASGMPVAFLPCVETKGASVMGLILLLIVVLLLVGSVPQWPYSREWGYGPSGAMGFVLLLLVILLLFRVI
jgi:uncharacterized protein DUF3309